MNVTKVMIVVIILAASATFWYRSTASVCPVPLPYRLGEIDASFTLSAEEAKAHIAAAEAVWEEGTGRELFIYDDTARFTVNFVYDERQEFANSENAQRTALDARKEENDRLFATVETLERDYNALTKKYERDVAAYERRLDEYNTTVGTYNDRGGAPPDVFVELEEREKALRAEANELSATAEKLNTLANELNELSERGNTLVSSYNRDVEAYNAEFGHSREFTQGDYQGDRINIYKFSSDAELSSVLAHEFGHALGLDHVAGTSSVMYYLLEETPNTPVLGAADRLAFLAVCGTGEEIPHRLRRMVRETLTLLTRLF